VPDDESALLGRRSPQVDGKRDNNNEAARLLGLGPNAAGALAARPQVTPQPDRFRVHAC